MTYFYEPRLGHNLPHDPFNAIVGPRPIGWVSSQSADGILNLAPYSSHWLLQHWAQRFTQQH
ncbi:MAG: hypothetical protein RL659_2031 [Pseudomonadota bacterium]